MNALISRSLQRFLRVCVIVLIAERLTGVDVGVSDVTPRDQQEMTPAELLSQSCGRVNTPVGAGERVTVMCPPRGVTGRYLFVQTRGRTDHLTLCEVEAGKQMAISNCMVTYRVGHIHFAFTKILQPQFLCV